MGLKERKMRFIEKYVSITNEKLLDELDSLLNKGVNHKKKVSIYDMVGVITPNEADEMKRIINETCETIHPDDWK